MKVWDRKMLLATTSESKQTIIVFFETEKIILFYCFCKKPLQCIQSIRVEPRFYQIFMVQAVKCLLIEWHIPGVEFICYRTLFTIGLTSSVPSQYVQNSTFVNKFVLYILQLFHYFPDSYITHTIISAEDGPSSHARAACQQTSSLQT